MAWRRGKPTNGTARKRTDLEIAEDRLFLVGLLTKMGRDFPVVDAWRMLNDRRATSAAATARALGQSEDEALAAGEAAKVSKQTANRDHRVALARLNEGGDAISAVFLDDRIAEAEEDLDRTYTFEDGIVADLERSRAPTWTRTRGRAPSSGQTPVPAELETHSAQRGADPGLWAQLIKLLERREKLRAELIRLKFGRHFFPTTPTDRTFAQALTGAETPAAARDAALALYAREIEALGRAEALDVGPLAPDLLRLQAARTKQTMARLTALRSYIALPAADEDGHQSYEIVVERVRK